MIFFQQFKELLGDLAAPLLISLFAGVATASHKREQSFFGFFCSLIVAGFTGVVTFYGLNALATFIALSIDMRLFIIGVSSFAGGKVLDLWGERLDSLVGKFLDNFLKKG